MASEYEPLADKIAGEEGVNPTLFRSLIQQESNWNPQARSGAGAIGLGQLMPGTARELGVDPQDPTQNLRGAARYLRQQLDRFGNPKQALAAYNAGPGRVTSGSVLPQETQNYVTSVMRRAGMSDNQQPAIDTESAIGRLPQNMQEPYRQQLRSAQQESMLQQREAELKGKQQEFLASGEADTRRQAATASADRLRALEGRIQTLPEFIPSRENATEMATLFSLLAVAGQALGGRGKQGAMGAMASMTGMLNGWRQGRQDLYQRERQNFETNLRQIQAQNRELIEAFNRAETIAQRDVEAGLASLRADAARLNAPILAIASQRGGMETTRNVLKDMTNSAAAVERQAQQIASQAPIVVPGEQAGTFFYARRDGTPIVDREGNRLPAPPPRSASGQQVSAVQFRYNNRVMTSVNQLGQSLTNLASMPSSATPPVLQEYLNDPSKRVTSNLTRAMAREITPDEDRAIQMIMADITRQASAVQAGGVPSGMSEAAIREFAAVAPRAGDSQITMHMFLAMMRQEMDLGLDTLRGGGGTREQLAIAERARDRIAELIPYTVNDMARIYAGGREILSSPRLNQVLTSAQNLQQAQAGIRAPLPGERETTPSTTQAPRTSAEPITFPTAEAAERELKSRNLPAGTEVPIIVNGRRGTWRAQ